MPDHNIYETSARCLLRDGRVCAPIRVWLRVILVTLATDRKRRPLSKWWVYEEKCIQSMLFFLHNYFLLNLNDKMRETDIITQLKLYPKSASKGVYHTNKMLYALLLSAIQAVSGNFQRHYTCFRVFFEPMGAKLKLNLPPPHPTPQSITMNVTGYHNKLCTITKEFWYRITASSIIQEFAIV